MKIHRWQLRNEAGEITQEEIGSVKSCKALLKEKGGVAFTEHYKGGDLVDCCAITLGNNKSSRVSHDASDSRSNLSRKYGR